MFKVQIIMKNRLSGWYAGYGDDNNILFTDGAYDAIIIDRYEIEDLFRKMEDEELKFDSVSFYDVED